MFETVSPAGFVTGLSLGASLIVAIGAQNAFVLRQGLRREQVATVVAVCALLDIALMTLGVAGLGAAVVALPGLLQAATVGGALVLGWYGLAAFRRAATAQALGISLLNPHVYVDTVLLVGSVGAAQAAGTRGSFLLGACSASVLWFVGLGFGARVLSPIFERAAAWRLLEAVVGVTMWLIAYRLLAGMAAG